MIATAHDLADDVLFAKALEADRSDDVPTAQLQSLADAGLYGVSISCQPATVAELIEIIASGCLTTAFVWTQHLGACLATCNSSGPVRDELGPSLVSGQARAGVAFAHLLRPGPSLTNATRVGDGWLYTGSAPWVTGWGHIDFLHVGARHGDDVVWALIDATESSTLHVDLLELAVVNASKTVVAHFDDHLVPEARVTRVDNYETWRANYQLGLRANGSLPLGVAARCCRLLGPTNLDNVLIDVRNRLNSATTDEMPEARAEASLLAVRAATALVASTGGRAVMLAEHAQRLLREAMFLMVQGQTPAIKAHMLTHLLAESVTF